MNTKRKSTAESNDGVRAVGRALDILMAFTATDHELSASDLLTRVDLSRPTLYRLLYTLEYNGFLVSVGEPQKFRLGPSVAHLAHVWTSTIDLADAAAPALRNLWKCTNETVALFVRQGAYRMCIAELPSPHALSFKRGIGYRERLVLGASGHAILAHVKMTQKELIGYAKESNVSPDTYLQELETVRQRGYAISKEELIHGAVSIAAPFFDQPDTIAGALVVFGPDTRLPDAKIAEFGTSLVREAGALSQFLCGKKQ